MCMCVCGMQGCYHIISRKNSLSDSIDWPPLKCSKNVKGTQKVLNGCEQHKASSTMTQIHLKSLLFYISIRIGWIS